MKIQYFISFIKVIFLIVFIYECKKDSQTTEPTTVTDIDGNIYNTIKLGKQLWMKENLKVKHYNNGDSILTTIPDTLDIANEIKPKYQWFYNSDENNLKNYGRLYTWYTVTDSRNLCPVGWHMPSIAEWDTLIEYLGSWTAAGAKLKEPGIIHWEDPNVTFNTTGFDALPGGEHSRSGGNNFISNQLHTEGAWWTSTASKFDSLNAKYELINNSRSTIEDFEHEKNAGYSVRCVRN